MRLVINRTGDDDDDDGDDDDGGIEEDNEAEDEVDANILGE